MLDWDDLRIFLAAARAGSLSAAAAHLAIDTATAGRRLSRLESALKATLFKRSRTGLELTAFGRETLEAALDAEAAMEQVARAGKADAVSGAVRLSAAEGFGATIIAPALPQLRQARPQLRVELAAQAGILSPSRREADIAITLAPPTSSRVIVEPLTDYELGLFASADYLQRTGLPAARDDLLQHEIVGYVDDLVFAPELRYLDEVHPALRPTLSSSSIRAQREIIAAHGGIGVLPCFMASGLERVFAAEVRIKRRFWIATHRDAAATARVRAVRDWLKRLVRANRQKLRASAGELT